MEVLIELQPGAAVEVAVPPDLQILQRMPPRLAIVATDEEGIRALERRPEISAVFVEDVPAEALARFDEVARLFAAGWNERRRPKERIGEGLPWDAPGFRAP
jgi:hypothetical protein